MVNKMKVKRIRYGILEELINDLQNRITCKLGDADDYEKESADEETGEINTECWRWQTAQEYRMWVEVATSVIESLEKL